MSSFSRSTSKLKIHGTPNVALFGAPQKQQALLPAWKRLRAVSRTKTTEVSKASVVGPGAVPQKKLRCGDIPRGKQVPSSPSDLLTDLSIPKHREVFRPGKPGQPLHKRIRPERLKTSIPRQVKMRCPSLGYRPDGFTSLKKRITARREGSLCVHKMKALIDESKTNIDVMFALQASLVGVIFTCGAIPDMALPFLKGCAGWFRIERRIPFSMVRKVASNLVHYPSTWKYNHFQVMLSEISP